MNLKRNQECELFLVAFSSWEQAWNSPNETRVQILTLFLTSYWIFGKNYLTYCSISFLVYTNRK